MDAATRQFPPGQLRVSDADRDRALRGRFGNYVPPVLEVLGLAKVEHNARNNRMRAR